MAELTAACEQDDGPMWVPSAAAFFDLDNTVMRGASLYYLARGLTARRYLAMREIMRFGWKQARYRLSAKENLGDISQARESALSFIAGRRADEMRRLSEEIFADSMKHRIWAGTRALAQAHLDNGERVWLITAAPVELSEVIADHLGLTGALGTVAEVCDGAYTGRLAGDMLHGPAKESAVRALAEAEGLDLEKCYAYSDSVNDLPMLSAVGNPVAVNPDAALRRHARANRWDIHEFRATRRVLRRRPVLGRVS